MTVQPYGAEQPMLQIIFWLLSIQFILKEFE